MNIYKFYERSQYRFVFRLCFGTLFLWVSNTVCIDYFDFFKIFILHFKIIDFVINHFYRATWKFIWIYWKVTKLIHVFRKNAPWRLRLFVLVGRISLLKQLNLDPCGYFFFTNLKVYSKTRSQRRNDHTLSWFLFDNDVYVNTPFHGKQFTATR